MTNKLTNFDIVERLLEIRKTPNACTRAEALKAFEKEYKHTQFYKRTHKNLTLLYYEVTIEDLLTLKSLLANAQEFINGLDLANLSTIMDQINDQTRKTYADGLNALHESGLEDFIKNFKVN